VVTIARPVVCGEQSHPLHDYAAFFCALTFANRARWAAAPLVGAAALMRRRRLGFAEVCNTALGGRPRLGYVEMPFKALMALSSRFRSAVSTATIC
jgi:hypothetical protein